MPLYPSNATSIYDMTAVRTAAGYPPLGVGSSHLMPQGLSAPHQNNSLEPLRVCEIHVYNPLTCKWSCIWKQAQNDPFLGVHLTLGHPRVLRLRIGHITPGVYVDFRDVSTVNSRYLADKKESEVQVRIWRRGISSDWPNSGGRALSATQRAIFQALDRAVDEWVREVGVTDMLLVGPNRELYSHFVAMDVGQGRIQEKGVKQENQLVSGTSSNEPTHGSQCGEKKEGISGTLRRPAKTAVGIHKRFSPEDPFPGRMVSVAPPWNRKHPPEQLQQEKLSKLQSPDTSNRTSRQPNLGNTIHTKTTPLPRTGISFHSFRSTCSTCNTVCKSGGQRQAHFVATKHRFICTICQPPTEWPQINGFFVHCVQTGHLDVEQYGNKIGNSNDRKKTGEQGLVRREVVVAGPSRHNRSVEGGITGSKMVNHCPVFIKETPGTEPEWKPADPVLPGEKHGQKSPPPYTPPISFKSFHSKCSTCNKLHITGGDGHQHADKTGHPVACIICRPPVTFRICHGLYIHYKNTGHTNVRQPVYDPIKEKRNHPRKNAEATTALEESLQNDWQEQNPPTANEKDCHGPIEGVAEQHRKGSNKRPQVASLPGSGEDPEMDKVTPPRKKRKSHGKEEKKLNNGRQERRKGNDNSKTGGKKQSKKRQIGQAPALSPSRSPAPSTSLSLSPPPLVEEKRRKKRKRRSTVEEKQKSAASSSGKASRRSRGKSQLYTKHSFRSRSRHRPLCSFSSSSSSTSPPPSSSSNSLIRPRSRSSIAAEGKQEADQCRLQELVAKSNELALKEQEIRVQRNQLKLEEQRLKLEIQKRQIAELAKTASSTTQSSASNSTRPSINARSPAEDVIASPTAVTIKVISNITCGACGMLGHRRTSKQCRLHPKT
ncbi:hypothetical protein BGX38DRAFT_314234 [Terfezia claveryi]|nr:hypothetical protein BGX38DRAFT_314234 [Terfezia claveryi]